MSAGWILQDQGFAQYIYPVDDIIIHIPEACMCVPDMKAMLRDDGSVAGVIQVIHHAADGRE